MYIKRIGINHLKEVAELEEQVYPPELCLGYEDYLDDFEYVGDYGNKSFGAFVDGKLKAYIICYRKRKLYISDLVCPNPLMLMPLLSVFSNEIPKYDEVEAEFRHTSYRMMKKIVKKFPDVVKITQEKKVESYYPNGEDMYSITFKINSKGIESVKDKRYLILKEIHCFPGFQVSFREIVNTLYYRHNMTEEEIMTYKSFILRHIHHRNLDALKMLGDTFRFVVYHEGIFRYQKAYDNMKKYLLEHGYTKKERWNSDLESLQKKLWADDRCRTLGWTFASELDSKYQEDTISFYRSFVKRKIINYYKKRKFVTHVMMYDKYGDKCLYINLENSVYYYFPRNFRNLFDAYIKELKFAKDINEKLNSTFGMYKFNGDYLTYPQGVPAIRKLLGEEIAYAYLDRVIEIALNSDQKSAVFHDWGYIIIEILAFKEYLTKGAFKHIFLNKSLNQINKIKSTLDGLNIDNSKYLDKKALRKAISLAIRKDEDIAPIVSEAVQQAEKKWLKSKRISQKMYKEMKIFIERMKRYSPHISVNMFFRYFGQKAVDMVKGKYEGFFQEQIIAMDYQEFGQFIKDHLKERTKRNKRLYGALSKICNIEDIFNGCISSEEFDQIMFELKQRNIEVPAEWNNLNKFYAKIEHKCSPEYLIAGNASVCCMSFGQENAVTYALEKGFGVVNIYYKDRVIANSVIWVNEPYHCLVLDNIEVHPNYTKFNGILEKLFVKTVNQLLETYHLDYAVQGASYNDLKLYAKETKAVQMDELKPVAVKTKKFYTDADYVFPLSIKISSKKAVQKIITTNNLLEEKRQKARAAEIQKNLERETNRILTGDTEMEAILDWGCAF